MRFRGTALALALAATFSATGSSHEPEVARGSARAHENAIVQPPPREPERATDSRLAAKDEPASATLSRRVQHRSKQGEKLGIARGSSERSELSPTLRRIELELAERVAKPRA